MKTLSFPDLHDLTWKAQLLARSSRFAIGQSDMQDQVEFDAQAMLDHLWELGFRPSGAAMILIDNRRHQGGSHNNR